MHCPHCGAEIAPTDKFCPACGKATEPGIALGIVQEAGENRGHMYGVQAGVIKGSVYTGDIHQVSVYVLTAEAQKQGANPLPPPTALFRFPEPYTALDQAVFCGRDDEIKNVVWRIRQYPALVIHGRANVGKTSLLAAGVIPNLVATDGVLVISVPDYAQPVASMRQALHDNADRISIDLPDTPTLPAFVAAVTTAIKGCLVLIFDHVERLFAPSISDQEREALIGGLVEAQQTVDPKYLRLVFCVRSESVQKLQNLLPERGMAVELYELPLLTRSTAQQAIADPLDRVPGNTVFFDKRFLANVLIPAMDQLSDVPGVQPGHLQIVCRRLYALARDAGEHSIAKEVYDEAGGVTGVMARHLESTLRRSAGGPQDKRQDTANRILRTMASSTVRRWVTPQEMALDGVSSTERDEALESLVKNELLVPSYRDGSLKFAFATDSLRESIRLLAEPQAKNRYEAEDELERAWLTWTVRHTVATRGQLRYVTSRCTELAPEAGRLILMLHSAIVRGEPASQWLVWLRQSAGAQAFVRRLEPDGQPAAQQADEIEHAGELQQIMGLDSLLPPLPADARGFGPLAWAAVKHPQAEKRQTAALALAARDAQDPTETIDHLSWALRQIQNGREREARAAELCATLADADPGLAPFCARLPDTSPWRTWLERARRSIGRGALSLLGASVGGALGAGVLVGLMRFLIALPLRFQPNVQLAMYFFWTLLLGAGLAAGLTLGRLLPLGPAGNAGARRAALAALLGAGGVGLAHLVVALFNGMSPGRTPLFVPLGLLAGAGLAAALYDRPQGEPLLSATGWLPRLAIAALAFALIQAAFITITHDSSQGLAISWNGGFYDAYASRPGLDWTMPIRQIPGWFNWLAILDSALLGVLITIGVARGMSIAESVVARWQATSARAGD